MAPFLGRRFVQCLEDGELKLSFDASGFVVNYYHLKLPMRMESYAELLKPISAKLRIKCGDEHLDYANFVDVVKRLENLSVSISTENRRDEIEWIKRNLRDLYEDNAVIRQCFEEMLQFYNEGREDEKGFYALGRLLSKQIFRLCYWKIAGQEINYRRFFDINELICLRQENRQVFDTTHKLIKRLVDDGYVKGVRIDHIDGLADPTGYLQQLRDHLGDTYILVEKILESEESLPTSWPIQGSTGYDFTCRLNGLFCDTKNEKKFNRIYKVFSKQAAGFEQIVNRCKRQVLKNQLGGDLNNLVGRIKQIANQTPWGCDMTHKRLKQSLTEILARFPVYRTYIDRRGPSATDRAYVQAAVKSAMHYKPQLASELSFIKQLLLEKINAQRCENHLVTAEGVEKIIVKFQQLTAPLTAKGYEDTALYVYNRLVSLNEVGGDPCRFGCNAHRFHEFIINRADRWPHTMNSTATHDSKRGEDARARINVLSELPEEWENHLNRWQALNRTKKIRLNGKQVPDRNEEYFLYQTLIGAFPFEDAAGDFFVERIGDYLVKAVREAKIHSSWIEANTEYEAALVSFAQKILHPVEGDLFLKIFLPFFKKVAFYAIWNTLSQTLLKITACGVPDFYQGTELFDFHLVDPDNRRPVDFKKRKQILAEILNKVSCDPLGLVNEMLADCKDGRIKLFLIARALRTRKAHAALFQNGTYAPLPVSGRFKTHVIAFVRTYQTDSSITVVPRFLTGLVKENQNPIGNRVWRDTEIIFPENMTSRWKNIFTEEILNAKASLKIGNILKHFPCALLIREDTE
jgi:(1->4)-alpha-D-glucan 1-alpha-D-glucosylmutase